MGRSKKKKKKWTLEEEQRLIKLCEDNPQTEVARKMRRSVSSVKNKRISMNIPSYSDSTDKLKISEVARLVGIDYQSIARTWVKYGFEIDKTGVFSLVTEDVLIEFMQEHTELWKASDCDYYFFYRFPWFIEKLKNEKNGKEKLNHYRNRKSWTDLDISRFKMLKSRGLTNNEIAIELGRTQSAVEHMSMRLKRKVI